MFEPMPLANNYTIAVNHYICTYPKARLRMTINLMFAFVLTLCGLQTQAKEPSLHFDRENFYTIIKTGNKTEIDKEMEIIASSSVAEKQAYQGFLLMRKAGVVAVPALKLHYFKQGYIQLETAISNDKDNAEYRFLRLIIQENAPKIVHYHKDMDADKQILIKNFKNLSPVVQQAVLDYSKTSKTLRGQDF
jgi:hypothetical protein